MHEYKKLNRNKILAKKKEWRDSNKDYQSNREKLDVLFKLKRRLRTRLHHALKGGYKTGSAIRDLGCSIEQLKQHLESKFESWMTWENWGPYDVNRQTWHIDHVVPLDSVNLLDVEQLKRVCSFNNLRPILAKENLSKGSKNAI
jgi:Uri superfamily endonuclease